MNRIKELREQSEITQEALALKLQVDRSTVTKWETGESRPRADKFPELARILGCTIDALFDEGKEAADNADD